MFHSNDKFDAELYSGLLQRKGIKISEYERIRRSELKTLQFYNNMVQSSFMTSQQLKDLENLKYQTRNFKLLSLSYKDFINENKKSSDKQKKDFYIKYKNIFSMPEKIDIEYIIFNKDLLKQKLSINLKKL